MISLVPWLMFSALVLALAAPYVVSSWHRKRRARIMARQIELTDAIHAELGAAAAPFVTKRAFGPWLVRYAMPAEPAPIDRLIAITHRVLGPCRNGDVEIVFTRARSRRLRAA